MENNITSDKRTKKEELKQAFHEQKIEKIKQGKIEKANAFQYLKSFIKLLKFVFIIIIFVLVFLLFCIIFYPDKLLNAISLIENILKFK